MQNNLLDEEMLPAADTLSMTVSSSDAGKRLDVWLSELLEGRTRSFIQKLIEDGSVQLN